MNDWKERVSVVGQVMISVVIILGFIATRVVMIFVEILPANQRSADTFDGALIGAFSAVVGFWIGSSYGGQKKDQTIADAAKSAAKSG